MRGLGNHLGFRILRFLNHVSVTLHPALPPHSGFKDSECLGCHSQYVGMPGVFRSPCAEVSSVVSWQTVFLLEA